MTLSDASIKNPVFAWMLMIGLIGFGGLTYTRLGVSQLPDVDFPVVSVQASWEGAAPEVMETEVADVLEDALMGVQGIREVSSVSRQGQCSVSIEFDLDKDIDVAVQEVQTKVAQAQRVLPRDLDPPVISKTNPEDQPIMWIALSGEKPRRFLMEYVRDRLKDRFTTVPGVGDVFLGGFIEPNLRVWVDAAKLRRTELTVQDVLRAIETQHTELPAGRIETGKQELNVRVLGEAGTAEEFRRIVIPERRGSPIWKILRIGDVAEVEEGLADVRRLSRSSGQPSVGLGIRKQRGANAVEAARGVRARIEEVRRELPPGVELNVVFDSTRFIEEAVREILFTLTLSALLTSAVCWLFLGSWSSAFNVILAIPTSILGAFTFIYFFGFTLNTFTLLALSLSIGIVVDDAIMVLENIVRHRERGESRVRAALVGAREITFAAMAATIAVLAVFLPVVFMKGIMGKFLFQFGVTMSLAVLLSLLEALTLAPMRCSQFLEVGHSTAVGRAMDRLMEAAASRYRAGLARCLERRWLVVGLSIALFAGSLAFVKTLRKEFVPSQDQGRIMVRMQTPIGSSIETTDEAVKKAEAFVQGRPEVARYFAAIGGFGGGEVNSGMMFVTLKPKGERSASPPFKREPTQQEFMGLTRKEVSKIPGMSRAVIQDPSLSGFTAQRGFPVEFTVRGPDWDKLAQFHGELMRRMEASGLMTDVDSNYDVGMPEIRVVPDRPKASERGVSVSEIAAAIQASVGGMRAGKVTRGGRRYDIRVRLVAGDRSRPEDISRISVRNNRGELVPLSDVVRILQKPTLLSISRKNRERAIGVFANVATGKSQGEAIAFVESAAREVLPEGYRIVLSGSAQTFRESFQGLVFALVLGIFVAYMVLGAQFHSFIHPVAVLLALPFSATGAVLALLAAGMSLNIYSMIGLLLLMGIVKKNSILLVDFTNVRRRHGMEVREALLEACPIRLRPIVMTSVSTIAAAVPLAFALGPGAETLRPMAVSVIGGVFVSTLLTLFVVPCAYSLMVPLESHRHQRALREALEELGEAPEKAEV